MRESESQVGRSNREDFCNERFGAVGLSSFVIAIRFTFRVVYFSTLAWRTDHRGPKRFSQRTNVRQAARRRSSSSRLQKFTTRALEECLRGREHACNVATTMRVLWSLVLTGCVSHSSSTVERSIRVGSQAGNRDSPMRSQAGTQDRGCRNRASVVVGEAGLRAPRSIAHEERRKRVRVKAISI